MNSRYRAAVLVLNRRGARWAGLAVVTVVAVATAAIAVRASRGGEAVLGTVTGTFPPPKMSSESAAGLQPPDALSTVLSRIWEATPAGCLRVVAGDTVLYEANADALVSPASVTKVLTASAALTVLGERTRLRTTVRADAPPTDGVIAGDLWLVGGGDPVLGTASWAMRPASETRLYTSLDGLADRVVAAGVRRIDGRIVGDESRYDATRYVDTWPSRLIADGEAGPLSALAVNDGFRVWGHPGVPFLDPPRDAAEVFTGLLEARGVDVVGPAASGVTSSSVVLAAVESPPVGDLVAEMLRTSDNETAELLVKEMGVRRLAEGSTAAGTRAVAGTLMAQGLALQGSVIADGSGLSTVDRVTCRLLTAVLASRSGDLSGRLAVGGRNGTVANRFTATPLVGRVRVKTGSLDGVAALAGYADNLTGTTVTFSYIVNGLPRGASGRALQDAFAAAVVETSL